MEHVAVEVPAETAFRGVVRLVVGGLASRCDLPYERVDDLQLAVDALLDHRTAAGDRLTVDATIGEELQLSIGPFLADPDVDGRRVSSALVERVQVVERDSHEWVELALSVPDRSNDQRDT